MSCDFCKRAKFERFHAYADEYSAGISLAGGSTKFSKDEQFKFCPECGACLSDPESLTLDELDNMHGMPVYISNPGRRRCEKWDVLDDTNPVDHELQDVNFKSGDAYPTYALGETWLAYRREPRKDVDHE